MSLLQPQTLVFMTDDFEMTVVDTEALQELEVFNVRSVNLSYDKYPGPRDDGVAKPDLVSYQSTVKTCGDQLYLLGAEECRRVV